MKASLLALMGLGVPLAIMIGLSELGSRRSPERSAPAAPTSSKPDKAESPPPLASHTVPLQPLSPLAEWLDTAGSWISGETAGEQSEKGRAGAHLADRDYPRAAKAFDRLLVRDPDDPSLLLGKGMALAGLGRHDDALPLFEAAIERDPDSAPARFNLAVTYARLGHSDAAAAALRELLRRNPHHLRARFNLAALLQSRGDHREAMNHWRGITDAPQPSSRPDEASAQLLRIHQAQAWSHRGECAMALTLPIEARTCFAEVTELEPGDARAWLNLGIARVSCGDRTAAVAALEQSLHLNPRLPPALNQLAYIKASLYRDIGDEAFKTEALELCRRSLAIASDQVNIRQLRLALEQEDEVEQEDQP